jgi:hypothetical protein
MRKICLGLLVTVFLSLSLTAQVKAANPGCDSQSPQQCLDLALKAMGGRERLQTLKSVRLQTIGHTLLMEQSYRQEPFITSYESAKTTLDLVNDRMLSERKLTWPEADSDQWETDSTLVVGRDGGVMRSKDKDAPCPLASLDAARQEFALGPARLLLTATATPDLRFEAAQTLRSTPHTVIALTWQNRPVRIFINSFNHLPDAVETTEEFHDFWYFWGDVKQRVYFDNWNLHQGIVYPTNTVEERNGTVWRSTQALKIDFDVPIDDSAFHMDAVAAKASTSSRAWNRPFKAGNAVALAPGVDLFAGAWNSTIIRQPDGLVILEAPISEQYIRGVIDEAKKRNPGIPIKAVLSTSDSWPHTGGVRYAVAQHFPVYILDLNRPLLDRMIAAPHALEPDALAQAKQMNSTPWKLVSHEEEIGSGANRLELYPLRGASTERQYMVYFPEHRLLYASDTLVVNDDNTLYDPELMNEVAQAVARENLKVDTVFAMHQGPTPWEKVIAMLQKSRG